jgi:ABC-type Zn uptake system ZnuABC Zn-binding protein ZnuA
MWYVCVSRFHSTLSLWHEVSNIASLAQGNVVFYSDDGAATWTKSLTVIEHCNEAQMVELQNGTLLLNARDEDHKNNASVMSGARRFSTS